MGSSMLEWPQSGIAGQSYSCLDSSMLPGDRTCTVFYSDTFNGNSPYFVDNIWLHLKCKYFIYKALWHICLIIACSLKSFKSIKWNDDRDWILTIICSFLAFLSVFLPSIALRLGICRDRRDRRSCKSFVSCVNFSRKQRSFLHILQIFTHLNVNFLHNY